MDQAGNGPHRTATMKGHIDKVAETGIREIVMLCNGPEIEAGDLPEYLAHKNMGWWADTFFAVIEWAIKKTVEEIAAKGSSPDYLAQTITRCDSFKSHRGYVLDDVHSISPEEFETAVATLRQFSAKPIVASFKADFNLTPYLPTIRKYKRVYVAVQLYRQDAAKEKRVEDRTSAVTRWLTNAEDVDTAWLKEQRVDVANLEYFKAGGVITSAADLKAMYDRCIAVGVTCFHGYAAVDTNGFRVWDYPDLHRMLKDIALDYQQRSLPVKA